MVSASWCHWEPEAHCPLRVGPPCWEWWHIPLQVSPITVASQPPSEILPLPGGEFRLAKCHPPPGFHIGKWKSVVPQPAFVPRLRNQLSSKGACIAAVLKEGAKLLPSIGVLLTLLLAGPKVLQEQMHQHEHLDITPSPFPGSLLYLIPRLLGKSNFFCKEMKGCSCQSQPQLTTRQD